MQTNGGTGRDPGSGSATRSKTSSDLLSVNYGTVSPALLKLEQEG
jgi:hypothetical protein